MRSAAKTWAADRLDQRHQGRGRGADPVGQRRDIEIDALAGIGRALAVERQMQAVLGEQHMGEQPWPGAPARDRMRGRRRLGDRLAGPAGELLPHVLDHLPLARHQLQRLGHVLAELAQDAAAARAGRRQPDRRCARAADARASGRRAGLRRRKALDLDRVGARRRACDLYRRLGFGRVLFKIGKLQLELVEQRARSEDWPNRSCRSLAMANLSFSIISASACDAASAAVRAARSASSIAFSVATSSGSESSALITQMESQDAAVVRAHDRAPIHNAAISPPPAAARSAAASASRSPPAR